MDNQHLGEAGMQDREVWQEVPDIDEGENVPSWLE